MNILLMVVGKANYISFIAACPVPRFFYIIKIFMYGVAEYKGAI